MPKAFDIPPKYSEIQGQEYTPRQRGALTNIGNIFSGIAAPFLGNYDYAAQQAQLQAQQDQADMEFQKYLMAQKAKQEGVSAKDAFEMAMLSKLFPDMDFNNMQGVAPSLSPNTGFSLPTIDGSKMSVDSKRIYDLPSPQLGVTDFKVGNLSFGQTPQSKAEMEIAKEAAKIPAKQQKEAESLMESTKLIGNLYNEAFQEVKNKIPNIGESGAEGIFSRIRGKVGKISGDFPKLKAFEDGIKAYATDYAKGAGEQRPTDEDIKRFLDTLPVITGVTSTQETNKSKMRNQLLKLQSKGVSYKWAEDVAKELGVDLSLDIKHGGKNYKIPYNEIGAFKKAKGIK